MGFFHFLPIPLIVVVVVKSFPGSVLVKRRIIVVITLTEVTTMNAMQEELILELRKTQEEIVSSLKNKQENEWMIPILKDELADIATAIQKLEDGNFGQCERSGEPLPENLLKIMPTIKSSKDS